MTRVFLACAAILLCFAATTRTTTAAPLTSEALQATDYIRSVQNTDGGFPDFGSASTPSGTIEALLAFSAAGIDARTVENGGISPDEYLATQAATYVTTPGSAAKLANGLASVDIDPTSFGGVDVLAAMEANYDTLTGKYGDDVFSQSLFMLAERALNRPVPSAANAYLISLQQPDGGWEYCCGFGTDTNTTAIAVRALIAGGVPSSDPAIVSAVSPLGYFHDNQTADGGFRYSAPFGSDASSTSFVILAIVAVGQSAEAAGPWDLGGSKNPLTKLASFQNPSTGAMQYFGSDNTFATYQSVAGLMLEPFPEQCFDTDADTLCNVHDADDDDDGCTDIQETGSDHALGGQRDPLHAYDFFDVPVPYSPTHTTSGKNGAINAQDVLAVRLGSGHLSGDGTYNDQYDRRPSQNQSERWLAGPPNGAISAQDALVARDSSGDICT